MKQINLTKIEKQYPVYYYYFRKLYIEKEMTIGIFYRLVNFAINYGLLEEERQNLFGEFDAFDFLILFLIFDEITNIEEDLIFNFNEEKIKSFVKKSKKVKIIKIIEYPFENKYQKMFEIINI